MIARRVAFTAVLILELLATPLPPQTRQAGAQPQKIPRVGFLWSATSASPNLGAFQEGLRDLGWVEGQNIVTERRSSEGRNELFPGLVSELIRLNVEVIVAGGGPASLKAARAATKTIPIVMVASSFDPVRDGLIRSFARPGGNITGLSSAPEELLGKRLELLKEAIPGLSRVGVLSVADINPRTESQLEAAARSLGLQLLRFQVRELTDLDETLGAAVKQRVAALLVLGVPMFVQHRERLAELLGKERLPAISLWRSQAEAGLLMTYGPSFSQEFRRAAYFVDKILKGAKPADLPVEQPTKFELVINLKTARALGLTIPPSLLLRADELIQ